MTLDCPFLSKTLSGRLHPSSSSAKYEVDDHESDDKTEASAAIIANTRTHGIPAAAENKEKNYENENKRHEHESSIQ